MSHNNDPMDTSPGVAAPTIAANLQRFRCFVSVLAGLNLMFSLDISNNLPLGVGGSTVLILIVRQTQVCYVCHYFLLYLFRGDFSCIFGKVLGLKEASKSHVYNYPIVASD